MGLGISKSIVESQDGRIWAAGDGGRGATFYLHHTLEPVADHPLTRIAELLPWNVTINTPTITPQARIGVHLIRRTSI